MRMSSRYTPDGRRSPVASPSTVRSPAACFSVISVAMRFANETRDVFVIVDDDRPNLLQR
jgi:hypothetical protein